ncbi:MAG: flagellar basal body rod protein FlgB [Proteobacteria bacterium]|nr:flagellar basal body rod protein FlgB [Pseudomonadota bacterium]
MKAGYPFDKTHQLLSRSMDISARRHNLITGNIANMDTIGHKPRDIDFQKTLEKAMKKPPASDLSVTHPDHFDGTRDEQPLKMPGQIIDESDEYHLDSVDIDREMENLVENNIQYRTAAEMLLRKIGILQYSITEGGK